MFSLTAFLDVEDEHKSLLYRNYFAFFCSGMMCTVLGALLPSIREEYGISYSFAGFLGSTQQIGTLLAVLFAGFLPYAIGRKRSSCILGSGTYIGMFLLCLTGNPLALVFAYTFMGMGRGTLSNITNVVVGQYAGNKGGGLNMLHAVFAVGASISPIIAMLSGSSGWRIPLYIIGGLSLIAMILLGTSSMDSGREKKEKGESVIPKTMDFWTAAIILFFYMCAESCLMNWLVTFVLDTGVLTGVYAILVQSLLWIMILVGRVSCAWLSTRFSRPKLIALMGTLMTLFFILLINTTKEWLIIVAVLGEGLAMSGIYPTTLATMPSKYNRSTMATGICIAAANAGGIIMPAIVGMIADSTGDFRSGFAAIGVALALMLVVMFMKVSAERKTRKD